MLLQSFVSSDVHIRSLLLFVAVITSCNGEKRRRLSTAAHSFEELSANEPGLTDCKQVQYNLAVRLHDQHFGLTAVPFERHDGNVEMIDSQQAECPAIYLHDDLFGKVMYSLDDWESGLVSIVDIEHYQLGSYILSDITEAFQGASDTTTSISAISGQGTYDLLDNNCATFVLSMMEEMNIPVTADLVSWAISSVANHESHLLGSAAIGVIQTFRAHPAFPVYFPDGDEATDSLILVEFAIFYLETHAHANVTSAVVGCAIHEPPGLSGTVSVIGTMVALLLGSATTLFMLI